MRPQQTFRRPSFANFGTFPDCEPKLHRTWTQSIPRTLRIIVQNAGVKRLMSTAYNPQPEGQTERTNQVLEGYVRTFVGYDQKDWYQLLPFAEHAYNHLAINAPKMTPFFANYGFHPQTEWVKEREAHNPGTTMDAYWMQDIHEQAIQTQQNTRESIQKYYDRKVPEPHSIQGGDLVVLNKKNIRTKQQLKKWFPKHYGPFKVIETRGTRAYQLEISPRWKILPMFHDSLLELYRSSYRPARKQPPRVLGARSPLKDLGGKVTLP